MFDHTEGLKEKFIRKGFWIYLFSFIVGPIGYLTKMTLSESLSVDEMGVLYGIISLVILVGAYNDLGFTEALHYFLPRFAVEKKYAEFKTVLLYALISKLVSSTILGIFFFFGAEWLSRVYFENSAAWGVLKIFSLFFFLENLLQISSTLFSVIQDTKLQHFLGFLRSGFSFLFVGTLWILGHGTLLLYSWAWVIPLGIAIIWSLFVLHKKIYLPYLQWVPFAHCKELVTTVLKYALLVLVTANVGFVLSQVDMQLIIFLLGTKDAGYYTNYLSLVGIPFLIITPIVGFLFPVISSFSGGTGDEKIRTIKTFFSKYFAAAAIPISLVLFLFGSDLAVAFFGEKFRRSGELLAYSAPFLIFNLLLQINFQILAGTGRVRERLKIVAIGLAINVPLNLLFIPRFGIEGSALAVGLSWIPMWYLSDRSAHKSLSPKGGDGFDWKFFGKNLLFMSLLSLVFFWLRNLWPVRSELSGRLDLFLGLSILAIVYIIVFALVNRKESTELFREIRSMMKKT